MTLRLELAALDRPSQRGRRENWHPTKRLVGHAQLGQPRRRLKVERRIVVSALSDSGAALEQEVGEPVEPGDDELVCRHDESVRYSLGSVNGLRRTYRHAAQG